MSQNRPKVHLPREEAATVAAFTAASQTFRVAAEQFCAVATRLKAEHKEKS